MTASPLTRADCAALDAADPLAAKRGEFALPEGVIYLDGNSLGALPKRVTARMRAAVEQEWGTGLIRSWNDAGWYPAPQRTGAAIARLIGAKADEVVVCDSTSVNLYKLLRGALHMRAGRGTVVTETGNFPTDGYISQQVADETGARLVAAAPDDIPAAIARAGDDLAVVHLTQVNYRTGALYDMAAITRAAHDAGALVIWDLCHSAGTIPVDLNGCEADFAVGCGYKYLNGGPGAPSFVFVANRHQAGFRQPIAGWHGHAQPFAFGEDYTPAPGIARMLTGTAPQLGLIALEEALHVFDDVDMQALREKGQALGDLFIALVEQECAGHGFGLASPRDAARRGSQVALTHPDGYAIMQALIARGVIGDFRAPDALRFGFTPLYIGEEEVLGAVSIMEDVLGKRSWDKPEYHRRGLVT